MKALSRKVFFATVSWEVLVAAALAGLSCSDVADAFSVSNDDVAKLWRTKNAGYRYPSSDVMRAKLRAHCVLKGWKTDQMCASVANEIFLPLLY